MSEGSVDVRSWQKSRDPARCTYATGDASAAELDGGWRGFWRVGTSMHDGILFSHDFSLDVHRIQRVRSCPGTSIRDHPIEHVSVVKWPN
jgi:hypothetical protein